MATIAPRTRPGTRGAAGGGWPGRAPTLLLALLCAGLTACSGEPEPATPAAAPAAREQAAAAEARPNPASRALAANLLNTASYPSEFAPGGSAKLVAGVYRDGEEGAGQLVVRMHRIAWGDLDGDGDEDAAVVLVEEPGGDRAFFTLHAVLNEGGAPKNVSRARLGNAHVNRVDVSGGEVVAMLAAEGEGKAAAEPTEVRYQLVDGALQPAGAG